MLLNDTGATASGPPGGSVPPRTAGPGCWTLTRRGRMRSDARIFGDERVLTDVLAGEAWQQLGNVASLPGVSGPVIGLPEIQPGYGFPIGVVAAFDARAGGVVVPGGIGYDINCGLRLLRSGIDARSLRPRLSALLDDLLRAAFCSPLRLGSGDVADVLAHGAGWAVAHGYGIPADVDPLDWRGTVPAADPRLVSRRALARGARQLGTVGSGNHFLEIGWVERVLDEAAASALMLAEGEVAVLIHTGSRALGYQVCADGVELMLRAAERYRIQLPDRQLACAPLASEEGRRFIGALAAAANYGYANRQVLTDRVRRAFGRAYGTPPDSLGITVAADSPHNLASFESHVMDGREVQLCVHRRGASRALPAGHPSLTGVARALGQPVVLPGDMGSYSLVLLPDAGSAASFHSLPHGAGRRLGRAAARRGRAEHDCIRELAGAGIEVRTTSPATLEEDAPEVYRDLDPILQALADARLARPVARLRPLGVLRG